MNHLVLGLLLAVCVSASVSECAVFTGGVFHVSLCLFVCVYVALPLRGVK